MVHVSSAGGRHKVLAFPESSINAIDTIITVNTKETSSNSSSSSPSPSSSNTSSGDPAIISSELHRELHIIAEEPTTISATTTTSIKNSISLDHNNSHFDEINGKLKRGKMNQNQDGSNGNANFLADSLNSNHNMNTQMKSDGLQLISHGLTDSVCESLKLLDNENENDNSRILEQNKVFTEEIVIPSSKKTTKTGIMKTTTHSSHVSTHGSSQISKTDDSWQKHYNIMEEGSLNESNDSEDTPLLPFGESEQQNNLIPDHKASCANATTDSPINASPVGTSSGTPTSSQATHKLSKLANGTKQTGLKRVSFGSSKGSMVETLVYESPISEEVEKVSKTVATSNGTAKVITFNEEVDEANGGSTGGSRPPSRVRVTFFESEKPLAVSSPESDIIDFDLSNMTLPGSPNAVDHTPTYNRQMSEGWDNPFRPDGDLSKEADQIVELIKEGKPINEETLRSKSPSVNESFIVSQQNQLNASPRGKEANGTTANGGGGPEVVQHAVAPAAQASQVEHVVLKKKKGCCVIQ